MKFYVVVILFGKLVKSLVLWLWMSVFLCICQCINYPRSPTYTLTTHFLHLFSLLLSLSLCHHRLTDEHSFRRKIPLQNILCWLHRGHHRIKSRSQVDNYRYVNWTKINTLHSHRSTANIWKWFFNCFFLRLWFCHFSHKTNQVVFCINTRIY